MCNLPAEEKRLAGLTQKKASNYAILPLSQMIGKDFEGYREGILLPSDFVLINSKLEEFVAEYNENEKEYLKNLAVKYPKLKSSQYLYLPAYRRQYICGINKNGDKIVWVNCFCDKHDKWKNQTVFVFDGGSCFFNLKIDITKKLVYDAIVNGIA